eukprot:jgi/Psemu1/31689/gm1.31689_g
MTTPQHCWTNSLTSLKLKGLVPLVHGIRKYPRTLAQASSNKGEAFGYLDNIEGDAGELVQVNAGMLSKTPASQVLSLGHHIAELDARRQ